MNNEFDFLQNPGLFVGPGFGASAKTVLALAERQSNPIPVDLHTTQGDALTEGWRDEILGIEGWGGKIVQATYIGALSGDVYTQGPAHARRVVGLSKSKEGDGEAQYLAQADMGRELGFYRFGAHFGDFDAPGTPGFDALVDRLVELCKQLKDKGYILCAAETGPEMPEHTAALIDAVNEKLGYVFLMANLDTGNPPMWGVSLDVLRFAKVLGPRIASLHLKNARSPGPEWKRGEEWPEETFLRDGLSPVMQIIAYVVSRLRLNVPLIREAEMCFELVAGTKPGSADEASQKHERRIQEWPDVCQLVSDAVINADELAASL